ncbi:MAG: HlyD family efflux transporter periplasmic adaptor subunit [Patescibacteria group bacterium]|jgi:RND family efflux transporter MFP subunit
MKKILKSKIFWAVVVILIIAVGAYFKFASSGKKVEYVTQEVKRGSISQTVSATGKVKSASEISLNFKNPGQLAILKVKTGDKVEADQILAQLKANDLAINVNSARADLAQALANLGKIKIGATTQDVAVSQAAFEKSKTDLANAQSDLDNTKQTYSQALQNEKQGSLVDANSAITKANISIQKVYDTLNFKNSSNYFLTSNTQLRQDVENQYNISLSMIDGAELAYSEANLNNSDITKVDSAINKTLSALSQVSQTLDNLSKLFDYVIINSNLIQTDLDALKTDINTERTTTNTSLTTIHTDEQTLADAKLNYQTKVNAAENDVKTAENNLAQAQANLDFKKAPARPEDISLYQAQVAKAQSSLDLAAARYDETIIKAPIAGVITDTPYSVGEQTNLTEPVIKMLAAENYEIEVDIPESDIVKISVGDKVSITLDAFTGDDIFSGAVTTINPAQTEIQDVIYYRVTVAFEKDQPDSVKSVVEKIKPGMTANITVKTAEINDVLFIPLRAVKEENGKKIVQILENDNPKTVEVILGLKGDEGMVEVRSGLIEGQKVITFVRNGA